MPLKSHPVAVWLLLATGAIGGLASASRAEAALKVLVVAGLAGEAAEFERQAAELEGWRKIFAAAGVAESDLAVIRSPQRAAAADASPVHRQVLDHLAAWKQAVGPADDVCLVLVGRVASFGKDRFFQVRGPRLAARDLAEALAAVPARSQTIFLTGPGGADFARSLVSETRVIVSATSDDKEVNATQFGAAWCKVALADPEGSFLEWLAAAEEEVKRYFAGRGALRTEHPLLLVGRQPEVEAPFEVGLSAEQKAAWTLARPSVPLAAADAAAIAAAPKPPAEPPLVAEARPAPPPPAALEPEPEPAPPTQSDPPQRHSYITSRPATAQEQELLAAIPDRADYPDQPGLILLKRIEQVVAENLESRHVARLQVAVFEPAGTRDLIDRTVAVPAGGRAKITVLKTIMPTGEVLEVDLEWLAGLGRAGEDGADRDTRRAVPAFAPGVVPGSVVECGYEITAPTPPFPSYYDETPLAEPLPIKTLSLRLATPAGKGFQYRLLDNALLPGLDPAAFATEQENPFIDARTWTWHDLPALPPEPGQLEQAAQTPRLAVSGYRSWDEYSDWARRLMRGTDEVTPEVERKARELTAGLATEEAKIKALYDYVAGLRYIALEGGANAWRPRFADSVLLQQYGDCKDKANLLVALLRAAGLTGHLALVRRAAPFTEEMPGCHFNHAIMAVERPEGLVWLDPTDEVCPYGMLPPGDAGQRALLVTGETAAFHTVPAFHDGYDRETRCEADLTLAADRQTARGTVRLAFAGMQDYQWRTRLRHLPAGEFRRALAARAREVWPGVAVEAVEWTAPRSLAEPLRAELTITLPAADPASGAIRMPGPWLPLAGELDAWPRRTPQAVNGGYPLAFRQVVTLRDPPEMALAAAEQKLPDHPTIRVGIGDAVEPGLVRRTSTLALDSGIVPPAAIPALRRALDAWQAGVAAAVVPREPPPSEPTVSPEDPS
jgi:transglutaminase-like putative cysteine protease